MTLMFHGRDPGRGSFEVHATPDEFCVFVVREDGLRTEHYLTRTADETLHRPMRVLQQAHGFFPDLTELEAYDVA